MSCSTYNDSYTGPDGRSGTHIPITAYLRALSFSFFSHLIICSVFLLYQYPFQVVYGFNPNAPIDILPLPTSERIHNDAKERADFILKMHETTKHNIEKMNEKYRITGRKVDKK